MKRSHLQPGRRPKALKLAPHTQRQRHAKLARQDAEAKAEALQVRLHGLEPIEPEAASPLVDDEPDALDEFEPDWLDDWREPVAFERDEYADPWWDHEHDRDDEGDFAGLARTLDRAA
jgi:hypothetical protein